MFFVLGSEICGGRARHESSPFRTSSFHFKWGFLPVFSQKQDFYYERWKRAEWSKDIFLMKIYRMVERIWMKLTLAWEIPWTEESGRLQFMGLWRVRHDWGTSLSLFTFMHWRRKWQSTPVFLPGESQGRGSLVGCHLWGRTESDRTEAT